MPQEQHVVKCYKCQTFQVQIVKKVNKFHCKMCREKQSAKKEYGRGTGKDCRLHVQKLNELRLQNQNESIIIESDAPSEFLDELKLTNENLEVEQIQTNSKWLQYMEVPKEEPESNDEKNSPFSNYSFDRPNKRKKVSLGTKNKNSKLHKNIHGDNKKCSNLDVKVEPTQELDKLKIKPKDNTSCIEILVAKSKPVSETDPLNKISSIMKKSKWVDFVKTEDLQETQSESEIHSPTKTVHSTDILKNIFSTDVNLDDILDL